MKNFELNVVNFNSEDVIATSCAKEKKTLNFGTAEGMVTASPSLIGEEITLSNGKTYLVETKEEGTSGGVSTMRVRLFLNYPAGRLGVAAGDPNYDNFGDLFDGIYHIVDGKYVWCEDGCNK